MSFTDQEAACFLCGSTQDPCGCQDLAEWHEMSQYHGGDADEVRACEACERYADTTPEELEHDNGMHAGEHFGDCPACDTRGI